VRRPVVTGRTPRPDPTGDERATFAARLELDLMTWSDRTAITYTEPETPR